MSVCVLKDVISKAPIMNHLLGYLSVVDYINLRRATVKSISVQVPKPWEVLSRRLIHRMRTDLGFSDKQVTQILGWLGKQSDGSQLFLTGGFLLALITSAPFDHLAQDVDVFSLQRDYKDTYGFDDLPPFDIGTDRHENYDDIVPFAIIRNFTMQKTRVQIVIWPYEETDSVQTIAHFDLSICKNAFNLHRGLHVGDLNALTRQMCRVDMVTLLQRIRRVEHRDSLVRWYERQEKRIYKYRDRGYDVRVIHPQGDALKHAFVLHPEHVSVFDQREMYSLMGTHAPPSCVFTSDCRCKSASDRNARYCQPNTCNCEHHKVFYRAMKERWVCRKREALAAEYTRFWSLDEDENN